MNLVKLQQTLIAAARQQTPDERVPLAFEKRIMARLAARSVVDYWNLWTQGLWRSAVSCTAIAVVSGVWFLANRELTANSNDLSQDLETTLLASVDQSDLSE